MSKTLDTLYRSQSVIYKYILYFLTIACIVFFFPRGGQFKYEFQKGKPWQYENLYAPFDFSIQKTDEDIAKERLEIRQSQVPYYRFDTEIAQEAYDAFATQFPETFPEEDSSRRLWNYLRTSGRQMLDSIYSTGLVADDSAPSSSEIYLVRDNEAQRIPSEFLQNTGSLDLVIEGEDIDVERIQASIAELGGSLHSIDEVEVAGEATGTED